MENSCFHHSSIYKDLFPLYNEGKISSASIQYISQNIALNLQQAYYSFLLKREYPIRKFSEALSRVQYLITAGL